ncbi:chaperone modulator CbpM [Roseomonas rosulenta]|uniref:chaperone modulator CbpM n=1 Tax=Roseomonas rosulenta TaxID=2748667 RepID=UPI0018DFFB03|nr:chaperone modulator CbpM [Roseomonas rosulenta]
MITLDVLCARFTRLDPDDLRRWIAEGHVRCEVEAGAPCFREIDVERVRLILELRHDLAVNEEALPVVLSLLDQIYALRRRLKQLGAAEDEAPSASA